MLACLCMLAGSCDCAYPQSLEEDAKSPGTGGSGCPEPPHVGAATGLGSLQEQQVLLIVEPLLQSLVTL